MWIRRHEMTEIAQELKEIFQKKIDEREPPERIWLTDTVYCGRKKILAMKGLKQRFTEQALNRLWLGIVVHEALKDMGISHEQPVEYMGVRGVVDIVRKSGEPMEVKVANTVWITSSKYSESHVEQLSRYALALGKDTGILFYYVPNISLSSLPAYRYEFDLSKVEEVTKERLGLLKDAAVAKDPFMLPATWHSESMDNWECKSCVFQELCRTGAYIV